MKAGDTYGPTAWRRVTQDDIDAFAAISGDHQWIHVDAERAARESPFGTTIAHGTLTLALIDGFRDELVPVTAGAALGVNLGYDRVRFPAPVPVGLRGPGDDGDHARDGARRRLGRDRAAVRRRGAGRRAAGLRGRQRDPGARLGVVPRSLRQ